VLGHRRVTTAASAPVELLGGSGATAIAAASGMLGRTPAAMAVAAGLDWRGRRSDSHRPRRHRSRLWPVGV